MLGKGTQFSFSRFWYNQSKNPLIVSFSILFWCPWATFKGWHQHFTTILLKLESSVGPESRRKFCWGTEYLPTDCILTERRKTVLQKPKVHSGFITCYGKELFGQLNNYTVEKSDQHICWVAKVSIINKEQMNMVNLQIWFPEKATSPCNNMDQNV